MSKDIIDSSSEEKNVPLVNATGGERFEITTACVDCVFAKFVGDTQSDCELGRIEKFKQNGTKVVEAYNDEKEFFLVKGFCNGHRNDFWKETGTYHRPFYKNSTERVRQENLIRCGFNVVMTKGQTIEDLKRTVDSIVSQEEINPYYIIVSCSADVERFDVIHYLENLLQPKEIKFFFVSISDGEATGDRCLDISFARAKNGYYAVFSSGDVVPSNFLLKINHALNEEMLKIVALEPEENSVSGLFMNATTYKLLRGNKVKPIMKKIHMLADAKGGHYLIKKWDELPDESKADSYSPDS